MAPRRVPEHPGPPIGRGAVAFLIWTLSDWLWKIFRLNKKAPHE
jgi:hypothetical protein